MATTRSRWSGSGQWPGRLWPTLCLVLSLAGIAMPAHAEAELRSNAFCGSGVTPTDNPSDLSHAEGDQSLQYIVEQQPANINSCSKGYILAKCGDFIGANKVFDKCVKAGYAGAMIWKAQLLEEGKGVAVNLEEATALLRRAALSSDTGYGPIGKWHYGNALLLGRGTAQDKAEGMRWLRLAATQGNREAREFLSELKPDDPLAALGKDRLPDEYVAAPPPAPNGNLEGTTSYGAQGPPLAVAKAAAPAVLEVQAVPSPAKVSRQSARAHAPRSKPKPPAATPPMVTPAAPAATPPDGTAETVTAPEDETIAEVAGRKLVSHAPAAAPPANVPVGSGASLRLALLFLVAILGAVLDRRPLPDGKPRAGLRPLH